MIYTETDADDAAIRRHHDAVDAFSPEAAYAAGRRAALLEATAAIEAMPLKIESVAGSASDGSETVTVGCLASTPCGACRLCEGYLEARADARAVVLALAGKE